MLFRSPDLIIRTLEGQAPMVAFEKIKRERWEAYQSGQDRETLKLDTLQDPWERCLPIEWNNEKLFKLADKWLAACLAQSNKLGYKRKLVVDGKEKTWPQEQLLLDGLTVNPLD